METTRAKPTKEEALFLLEARKDYEKRETLLNGARVVVKLWNIVAEKAESLFIA